MSESDDQPDLWLLLQRLGSHSRVVVSSHSVWEISEVSVKPCLWKRVPFQPRAVHDYLERKKNEKKKHEQTDYAMLEGEYMYRYQVIEISGEYLVHVEQAVLFSKNFFLRFLSVGPRCIAPWVGLPLIRSVLHRHSNFVKRLVYSSNIKSVFLRCVTKFVSVCG